MEQIDKYLETPLTKKLEDFKTYYADRWRGHLSGQDFEIMQDAYCVGISEMRVEKDLSQNDYISIYKNIIMKCRSLECQANQQYDNAWKEQLKKTRQHYQVELLKTLTATIRDYCMEED